MDDHSPNPSSKEDLSRVLELSSAIAARPFRSKRIHGGAIAASRYGTALSGFRRRPNGDIWILDLYRQQMAQSLIELDQAIAAAELKRSI